MKKFFISAMLLLMITGSFCQQKDFSKTLTQQDYLQKSKKQKTAAWIMLGGRCCSCNWVGHTGCQ
jgi:hypothetical protein